MEKGKRALEESARYQQSVRESTKEAVGFATALGGQFKDYGIKLSDIAGKMKKFVSDPGAGIAGAIEGFTDVVNLENLALNILVGMGEQMLNLIDLQTQFTKQTGMGAGMAYQGFDDARVAANDLGGALIFTREEAAAAFGVLTSELPVFTRLSTEARGEIASITMALGAVGVNAGDTAVILNQMMSVMGYGPEAAAPHLKDMVEDMRQLGVTPAEFSQNLAMMLPKFAEFGRQGEKIFTELQKKPSK